jgi:hypothetical protein
MHVHMLTGELLDLYMNRALDSLEGPLPRLVFLTSLRDPYTGRYLHEGWATVFPPDAVHATLRDTHRSVFESVVNLMLPALCNELRRHFHSLGEEEQKVAKLWLETEPYHEMIPEGCALLPRRLFISQVRVALEVLTRAPDWEFLEEPIALPLQQPVPLPQPHWPN